MARYDEKTDENRRSHTLLPRRQNRGMRTEQNAEMNNRQRLHIRKDGAEGASIINISSSRDRMSQPQTESQRWHCYIDPHIGCQSG